MNNVNNISIAFNLIKTSEIIQIYYINFNLIEKLKWIQSDRD